MRATREARGDDSYGTAGVVTILAGPFGLFVKGKDVEVAARTEYVIFTDGERRISERLHSLEALVEDMKI